MGVLPSGVRQRVVRWLIRVAGYQPSGRTRRWLLGGAAVLFLGLTAVALPRIARFELDAVWVAVAVAVSLLTPLVNAVEYWLAGRWVGVDVSPGQALQVTVLASAANLAPVPGAVVVRGRELFSHGGDVGQITRALAAIGVGWVAVALAAAGLALVGMGATVPGLLFLAAVALSTALLLLIVPNGVRRDAAALQVAPLEAASVAVQAVRIYAVFQAFGFKVGGLQALGFPAAGAVASGVGLFPGGLGLRELLSGGIAPLLGLAPAVGVLGAAADRIVGLGVLTLASVLIILAGET